MSRKYFDSETIQKLKKNLEQITLVGEYIGGYFNNHIEVYSEEKIVFFGVVKKDVFI